MTQVKLKLATPGKRFMAHLIDAGIPLGTIIFLSILKDIISSLYLRPSIYDEFGFDFYDDYSTGLDRPFAAIILLMLIAFLIVQLIFVTRASSIGKTILKLQVVSADSGKQLSPGMMLFREILVKYVSYVVFFLGFIWIFIDEKNRGWHDMILNTYVVELDS